MIAPKENYLAHMAELRDAGRQLMHLFAESGRLSEDSKEQHKIRRCYLEAELYVLQIEDVIEKMES